MVRPEHGARYVNKSWHEMAMRVCSVVRALASTLTTYDSVFMAATTRWPTYARRARHSIEVDDAQRRDGDDYVNRSASPEVGHM
jgi:hypothetical protein